MTPAVDQANRHRASAMRTTIESGLPDANVREEEPLSSRVRMILAAERLIAERGIEAVSLREIGVAAGQHNNSAAQYHFGTRAGLVAAIYKYRMQAMNERRLRGVGQVDRTGDLTEMTALVELLVLPLIDEVIPGETWHARFLFQLSARGAWAGSYPAPARSLQDGVWSIGSRIKRLLADLPDAVAVVRLRLALGLTLKFADDLERGLISDREIAASVVTDAIVALLTGPSSAQAGEAVTT